jgi:hypothetical protein
MHGNIAPALFYNSEELALFQGIVEDALAELSGQWNREDEADLRARLTTEIFRMAGYGARDRSVLKRFAVAVIRNRAPEKFGKTG